MDRRLKGILGIAYKAGRICTGESKAIEAIRKKKAFMLLLSSDASNNTVKKFQNSCKTYNIPFLIIDDTKYEFGRVFGKPYTVSCAVCDEGFSKKITEISERID